MPKEEKEILVTPLINGCEEKIEYDKIVKIFSDGVDVDDTMKILNLDNSTLRNLKKATIMSVIWCKDEMQKLKQEEIASISSKKTQMVFLNIFYFVL